MKTFLVFAVPMLCAVVFALPAAGQRGGRTSALGGRLAPTGAMNHPLGGFTGPGPGIGVNRGLGRAGVGRGRGLYPYGYSYYIPGYFDFLDNGSYVDPYYAAAMAPSPLPAYAPLPSAAPQQPVIINQYFGAQGPQPQINGPEPGAEPQAAGGVIGTPQNYYLIAYKNHAIYSALAYWVEDKTLHYVTTQNTHNQASLDLIDLALTKNLNRANDVPFSIPGQ
ncbi:MAG: hypothetical protein ABSG41_00270 [Bryobacteraceae bacterium]|jgi:hypothetical protein